MRTDDRSELARLFGALLGSSRSLARNRLVHLLSLDKGWFPPAAARRIVAWAESLGVLVEREGRLALFQMPGAVPLDYAPPQTLAERVPADLPDAPAEPTDLRPPRNASASPAAKAQEPARPARPVSPFDDLLARLEARGVARERLLAALHELPEGVRTRLVPEAGLLLAAARLGEDVAEEASELYGRVFPSRKEHRDQKEA